MTVLRLQRLIYWKGIAVICLVSGSLAKTGLLKKALEYPDIEKAAAQIADKMNFRSALAHIEKYDKIFN